MSVSEHELLTIGQKVNACRKHVNALERSPSRFTLSGKEDLRLARAALRLAIKQQKDAVERGQMLLIDAPLKEKKGKKK